MNRRSFLHAAGAAAASSHAFAQKSKDYRLRWVYVSRSLGRDSDVEDIRAIARTSSAHGLNGMLLAGQLESPRRRNVDHDARVREVKKICEEAKLEIIPLMFSVGYG